MEAPVSEIVQKPGLLERFKDALSPDQLAQRFNLTKSRLIEMGIYFIIGFLLGYFLKKYSRFVFAVAFSILILVILHHVDLISITVNWPKIQDLLGLQPIEPATHGSLLTAYWDWVKSNVGLALSFAVGLLLGIRFG